MRTEQPGLVGWPGAVHIPRPQAGRAEGFGPRFEAALASSEPTALEEGTIPIGFAHRDGNERGRQGDRGGQERCHQALCRDGRMGVTRRASTTPMWQRHLLRIRSSLTAGCAKYRYNKLSPGDINGIPRILDAGSATTSSPLAYIALQSRRRSGWTTSTTCPSPYDIAWYEQKAVLLALLYLGVKHIRLGPVPAFLSGRR